MNKIWLVFYILCSFNAIAQQPSLDSIQTLLKAKLGRGESDILPYAIQFDSLARLQKDALLMAKGKNFMGMSYYLKNNHEKAVFYYLQALDLFRDAKDDYFTALCLNNLGAALQYKGDPSIVIDYYKQALVLFQKEKNDIWVANVTNNIAIQYLLLRKFDDAILYTYNAKAVFESLKDTSQMATMTANLSSAYREKGDMFKAKDYAQKYLDFDEKYKQVDLTANVYSILAYAAFQWKDYETAHRYNNQSIAIRKSSEGEKIHLPNNYLIKSEIYEGQHLLKEALQAYKDYKELMDTVYNQEKDERISRLTQEFETKYEVEKKVKEAEVLSLKLNNTQIEKQNVLILFGSLSLLALTLFYFHVKRTKYRSQLMEQESIIQKQTIRKIEQESKLISLHSMIEGQEAERSRIAHDLHDGLGGMLTTVKAHFNSLKRFLKNDETQNSYEKTNKLIDDACIEVRRIAHNMVPHSIKISGLSGALEDLKQSVEVRGMACELELFNLDKINIPEHKSNMIYRIVQEVSNNALKHSHGHKIFMQLMAHDHGLNIMIEDDGEGFEVNEVVTNKGLGLNSIASRVAYLNGRVNYDSSPEHGTTVSIEIPL